MGGTAEADDASDIENLAGSASVPPTMLLRLRPNHASASSNVLVQSDKICLRRKIFVLGRLSRSIALQGKPIYLPPEPKYSCMKAFWGRSTICDNPAAAARREGTLPLFHGHSEQIP